MTCIYDAWSAALKVGHSQIQLRKEPVFQQTMFDEYIHIDVNPSKAKKVIRSIRRDISEEAYLDIYYASLSADEDALQAIYNFLRVGFAVGNTVTRLYTNPHVVKLLEIRRRDPMKPIISGNLPVSRVWIPRYISAIWNPKMM